MEMLKLEPKEFERKICEAVRKAERLPENYRLYVHKLRYTITKDETPNEVQAEVFVTEGKIDSVKYLLAWDGEKNEFCRPQMIWRKYAHYRVMADFGMFNPLTRAVAEGYQEYAIAHLLRELGFRKESAWYIVKAKGMKPVKFKLNRNNHWHIEHYDFNGDYRFYPSMGQQWELPWGNMGIPYYQPFDHEGNIYTVPSLDQIHEFCCRRGFACYGIHEPQEIIRHLVFMYRTINNDPTAFRKYVERK